MIMRKKSPFSLIVFAIAFSLMSLPRHSSEKIRGVVAAGLSPAWEFLAEVKSFFQVSLLQSTPKTYSQKKGMILTADEEVQRLQLENQMFRSELAHLQDLFRQEHDFNLSMSMFELQALPARVIFRAASSWNHSFWINVGKKDNEGLGFELVAKNSPVIVGTSLVGVIDYVGEKQSKVRLITDSALTISVRVARSPMKEQKTTDQSILYLAKGELHGSGKPLWRSQENSLHGIGFNYDFSDEYGEARDLRTGQPLNSTDTLEAVPMIQVDDLLVTTGLDGIFPAGLHVGEVTNIHLLREGDYYYELEAKPTAKNLHDLSLVFIIPPVGYEVSDEPPIFGEID